MGVVYKARQVSLNRIVALKMILSGRLASSGAIERFQTEAEAAARLEHPNIVPIYEIGEREGAHYFTMRLVEGGNLRQAFGGKPLPMVRAAELIVALARAMDYAHRRGVLHRDLKPANVLLDSSGQPQITDFGLAKLATRDTGLTRSAAVMGTPNYMAPEQAAGQSRQATAAADIYSLGAILYELLTGRPPFRGETEVEVLRRVLEEEPRTLRSIQPKLDRGLETICLKCLQKEPHRRYSAAEDLAADLERWLRHEPIHARPSTLLDRSAKWMRRRPLQAALGAVILLSAVVASLLWSEASRQRAHVATTSSVNMLKEIEELFGKGDSSFALARLARLCRDEPMNSLAATRLMMALTQRPFAPLVGELRHTDEILSAEYNPDGHWIVTASRDHTAKIWDSQTARLSHNLAGHNAEVICARFSPDGRRVGTGSADQTARIWDVSSGLTLATLPGHEAAVRWAEFSPDGQRLLTVATNVVRVWDIGSTQTLTIITAGPEIVRKAHFNPDGDRLVTASQDGFVQIWNARTGQAIGKPLRHNGAALSALFSPDGSRVVTTSQDSLARIWVPSTGEIIPLEHAALVSSARLSPDGQQLLTGCADGTVHFWDVLSGKPISTTITHGKQVTSAIFSPDGLHVLSAADDGRIRLWDTQTGEALAEPIPYPEFADGIVFRPDGGQFLAWSSERSVRLWQKPPPPPMVRPLPRVGSTTWVEFSRDGKMAVSLFDRSLIFWDTQSAKAVGTPQTFDSPIQRAQFDTKGQRLLLVAGIQVQISDLAKLRSPALSLHHDRPVQTAEFSQDGRWIVTVSGTNGRVWNAQTGAPTSWHFEHDDTIESAQFSPDGERLVTASRDRTARIWDIGTGSSLSLVHTHPVLAARFSPDGLKVATGATDGTARIWDAKTGQPLVEPLHHPREVNSIDFSPDSKRLATAGADQTIRIWDARSGQPLADPLQTKESVWGVRFTSSGRWIVTQSGLMWEVPLAPPPPPAWLGELAEAIGGQRLDRSNFASTPPDALLAIKQRLQQSKETDPYTIWARWLISDPQTRPISPSARITLSDYVERQILANTIESLEEALRLSPTNSRAKIHLTRLLPDSK
jgi:WD40 repeat protein/serine/threonine protein kinase